MTDDLIKPDDTADNENSTDETPETNKSENIIQASFHKGLEFVYAHPETSAAIGVAVIIGVFTFVRYKMKKKGK